jgi:GNAT superfamily N-acetyltransferase
MTSYGEWQHELVIDGEKYRADEIERHHAVRAGVARIFAIFGTPPRFRREIVRAAQVCEVPHTWRVKECTSESEVTPQLIEQGLSVLSNDEQQRGVRIVTYVAQSSLNASEYEFLGAGAVRNKLTRDYENDAFPVISRAVVAPAHRGKGLGSLLVEHRLKAVQRIFSTISKAIHFGTESDKMLHAFRKAARELNLTFVYIGDEQYEATDGVHTVHDYLAYLPWYQEVLLTACDALGALSTDAQRAEDFKRRLALYMLEGVERSSGNELERSFEALKSTLTPSPRCNAAIESVQELFTIRNIIGVQDPAPAANTGH